MVEAAARVKRTNVEGVELMESSVVPLVRAGVIKYKDGARPSGAIMRISVNGMSLTMDNDGSAASVIIFRMIFESPTIISLLLNLFKVHFLFIKNASVSLIDIHIILMHHTLVDIFTLSHEYIENNRKKIGELGDAFLGDGRKKIFGKRTLFFGFIMYHSTYKLHSVLLYP
jgi:hypothetical protein